MSLLGGITGANDAKKSGKQAAKGQKKAEATRRDQLAASNKLYADQQAANTASTAQATGALNTASNNQQNALRTASNQQQGALQGDLQQQHALYDPYTQYGQQGMDLMHGGFGEDPASSAAFMERFKNSPQYQATYQAAMDEARNAAERAGSASGGLNGGAILKELAARGGQIGLNTIGNYYNMLNGRIGQGMQAANAASGAYGSNALGRASAYGNTGQLQSSAYGNTGNQLAGAYGDSANRGLQSGQTYSNNMNNAYGGISDAQVGYGQAKAAGTMGAANSTANFTNGLVTAGGNALGGGFGGGNGAPMWQNALSSVPGNYR